MEMQVCVSICWNRISACSFSEEHKCDASLTKQLLPRLHMLDSIFCSSASQYVIIRIRSMIRTCSVAVNYRLHIKVPQPVTTKHAGTRSSSLSGDTNSSMVTKSSISNLTLVVHAFVWGNSFRSRRSTARHARRTLFMLTSDCGYIRTSNHAWHS